LKMTRLREERLTPRKKLTNNHLDKLKSIRPIRFSMTVRIKLRLFTPKCLFVMSKLSKRSKLHLRVASSNLNVRLIFSGRTLKSKRWKNMMRDSVKN